VTNVPAPHPSRCAPTREDYEAILRAHEQAVMDGEPSYRDPATGFMVLTIATHLERGECCGRGCRHCPFIED